MSGFFFLLLRHRGESSDSSGNSAHQCCHWFLPWCCLWIRAHLWPRSQCGNLFPLAFLLTLLIALPQDPHMFLLLGSHQVLLLGHLQPTNPFIKALHLHPRIFMLLSQFSSCIPISVLANCSFRFEYQQSYFLCKRIWRP